MTIKLKNQTREMRIQPQLNDADNAPQENTVLLSFSSQTPVVRNINGVDYNEVLLHGTDNVDLSRLVNSAPLLFNHDCDKPIGVIETASIGSDMVGRALVRFSTYGDGPDYFGKVQEGTLTKVSVGYEILEYEILGNDLNITRWMPYEISVVSIPADDSVGVGRSLQFEDIDSVLKYVRELEQDSTNGDAQDESTETNDNDSKDRVLDESNDEADSDQPEQDESTEPDNAVSYEEGEDSEEVNTEVDSQDVERAAEIEAIARTLNLANGLAEEAIKQGMSIEEFKNSVRQLNNKKIIKDDKKMENISLNQVIRSALNGDKVEVETGKNGMKISNDMFQRALNSVRAGVTTATAGDAIHNDVLYGSFVDVLRANSILKNFPIQMYTGLTSEISIPKLSADFTSSFGFIAEDGTSPEVSANFEAVKMTPSSFTGSVPLTRTVVKSMPQVEQLISQAIVAGSAIRLETLILQEIVAQATTAGNVTTVSAYDYETFVTAQGVLGDRSVNMANVAAIMSETTRAKLRNTLVGANTGAVYLLDDGDLCGLPAYSSSVLAGAGDFVILGDFSNVAIASWGDLELDLDDTTNRNKGSVIARVWADIDYVLTRPEAFQIIKIGA
ncbi:phage major capsid protein [Rouxiella sp. T17]|uniref:phage major capsid family protein n=1 Tax=Rouxiella sp. T17 TaxID=3085684 RepID=UPI002FC887AA